MEKLLLSFESKIKLHNKYLGFIKISKLIKNDIIISSEIQRLLESNIIENIIEYQLEYYKLNGDFNFLGIINIHYCKEKDILFLIDGQHRFEALKKLYNEKQHDIKIGIELIYVEKFINLKRDYEIINKNTPSPQFPSNIDKSIPESVARHFEYKYHKSIWSKSPKARRPHMNYGHFQESLGILTDKLKIDSSNKLQEIIENYNLKLKNQDILNFPDNKTISGNMLVKCKKNNFYLGLYKHISNDGFGYKWVEEIINLQIEKENTIKIEKENTVKIEKENTIKRKKENTVKIEKENTIKRKKKKFFKKKKKSIPKRIKDESWNRYIGNKRNGICVCCRLEEIDIQNFDASHIISEKNGGEIILDNIIPLCRQCNSSMGSTNMKEYITNHFPKNIKYFNNRDYSKPSFLSRIIK